MFYPTKTSSFVVATFLVGLFIAALPRAVAQVAAEGTPGDRVVYTLAGGATLGSGLANSVVEPFEVGPIDDTADSFAVESPGVIELTAGHHLVLHGARYQNTAGRRGAIESLLKIDGTAIPYGAAGSYCRDGVANNVFIRGGTIIDVMQGQTLEVQSERTDNDLQTLNRLDADLQLVKLDDTLDYLRLGVSADIPNFMPNTSAGPSIVSYDVQDEPGTGAFGHTSGTGQITLNEAGRYLVFANTGVRISGTNRHRQTFTQHLTLDEGAGFVGLEDGNTQLYLRYSGATDGAGGLIEFGTAAIGIIVETTVANAVLQVEMKRDNNPTATNTAVALESARTGLAILKLPGYGQYLNLSGGTQDLNVAQVNPETPIDLSESSSVSNAAFTYDPVASNSDITINTAGDYLFLASFFADDYDTPGGALRGSIRQGFQTGPAGGPAANVSWGHGGSYHRDQQGVGGDRSRDVGDWAGAVLSLAAGDTVATSTGRYGATGVINVDSVGLQALNIGSISSAPLDPVVSTNTGLALVIGTSATITGGQLETLDANNSADELTYTLLNEPSGGTLRLNGAALAASDTFTQADIDNGLLTFDAGVTEGTDFGFEFEVLDIGGANEANGSFVIAVGVVTVIVDDTGATDEDTAIAAVDGGGSLLANDTGTGLAISAHDALSANGAAVSVASDGTFSYDPAAAAALQALDDGESVVDTFGFTIIDFTGAPASSSASITITGLNDVPTVVNETFTAGERSISSGNVLANDSDVDTNDALAVLMLGGNAAGTFVTPMGATLTFAEDGSVSYDPCTSLTLTGLAPGATDSESFAYDVSDGTVLGTGMVTFVTVGEYGTSSDVETVAASGTINIEILTNDSVGGAAGLPTAGAPFDLNAALGVNSDSTWNNSGSGGNALTMQGAGTASVLLDVAGIANAPVGVTAAYDLSGTGSGAPLADVDQTTPSNVATQYLYGTNFSNSSCTIEAVLRPDDHVGPEPIWGSGGNGTGSSLVLIDDQLIYTACQAAIVAQARATIPATAQAGGDYVHVIATLDVDTETASIYINGVLVDSQTAVDIRNGAAGNISDWSGTDDEGLGMSAGTTGGDTATAPGLGGFGTVDIPDFNDAADRFDGEIAIVRVYSAALTPAEVTANFEAVFGVTNTAPVVGDLAEVAGTEEPDVGDVIVLPSGATVTVEADGSLTYNPNGAFDDVGVGLTATDTFTYSLFSGGLNATATVKVTINGSNADPQIEIAADTADVTEGTPAGFTITSSAPLAGAVDVALSYTGSAIDGADFTGSAMVTLPAGGTPFALDLPTTTDGLFEGPEDITVTIDSVTGSSVLGATTSATIDLLDSDPIPEFTITGPAGAVTEGSSADFTITASNAAAQDVTIDLAFSGSADITDGYRPVNAVVFAGQTSATVTLQTFDDGHTEGAEAFEITLASASLGTIGAADTASVTIMDGSATAVFAADFEGVDPASTPGGTLLGTDAPAAADAGTSIGSWLNILTAASGGAAPGLTLEQDDVRGDGVDTMLRLDRPATPAEGLISAVFAAPLDISGANVANISFDVGQLRTLTADKDSRIVGLDASGNKSFELLIAGANVNPDGRRMYHVDSVGTLTAISPFNTFPNTQDTGNGGNNESIHTNVRIDLTSSGYTVTFDYAIPNTTSIDGAADLTTGTLDYAGTATAVSQLQFQIAGSTDVNFNGGLLLDNITAAGVPGQQSVWEEWRAFYFGSPANAGAGADDNDANANGLVNFLEFALGLDPAGPAPRQELIVDGGSITQLGGPSIWIDPADGSAHLRFTRRTDFEDSSLLFIPQSSPDGAAWTEIIGLTIIATGDGANGVPVEVVQAALPAGAETALARVRVIID